LIKSDTSTVGELSENQTDQAIPEQPQPQLRAENPVAKETAQKQNLPVQIHLQKDLKLIIKSMMKF